LRLCIVVLNMYLMMPYPWQCWRCKEDPFPNTEIYQYICYSYTLEKIHQYSFTENSVCFSKSLWLIHLDFLELSTLSCSKYKWVITFLNDYSFYCNITFLYKKSEATEAIKSIFWMWLNTTSYSVKRLYTDNEEKYITSELQSFLRKQEIIHKTSTLYIYQQQISSGSLLL